MARKLKTKVDYFPHLVKHGKTITILEDRYGNDGYAFWFKLLERLGDTEGHYIRVGNPADLAYLASYTHTDPQSATEILNLLAVLEAIDPLLWNAKTVWCQNFVDNLESVYSKRGTETPQRPSIRDGNDSTAVFPVSETDKVKESKVEERKAHSEESVSRELGDLGIKLWRGFEQAYGVMLPDQGKQRVAVKDLVAMATDRGDPSVILPVMMAKFKELKDSGDKFWARQPYTPAMMMALWAQVWEAAKIDAMGTGVNKAVDETLARLKF